MGTPRRKLKTSGGRDVFPALAGLIVPIGSFALGGWLFSWLVPDIAGRATVGKPVRDERPLVVIDAGHGGEDGGTQGHKLLEKNCTLDVARRTARLLTADGRRAMLTRESDCGLSLAERTSFANDRKAACFVSIHFNNSGEPGVQGIETYFSDRKEGGDGRGAPDFRHARTDAVDSSRLLAEWVQRASVGRTRSVDRGIRLRSQLAVLRRTECPAVLIEGGFLSNKSDASRVSSDAWRERLARGIADGINKFLEVRAPVATVSNRRPAEPVATVSDRRAAGHRRSETVATGRPSPREIHRDPSGAFEFDGEFR